MFNRLTSRAALAGTASIAALGVAVFVVAPTLDEPAVQREEDIVAHVSETPAEPVTAPVAGESVGLDARSPVRPAPRPADIPDATASRAVEEIETTEAQTENLIPEAEPEPAEQEAREILTEADSSSPPPVSDGIALSGSAEMGIAAGEPDVVFTQDVDVEFSMEEGTDSSLSRGAKVDIPENALPQRERVEISGFFGTPIDSGTGTIPQAPNTETFPEAEHNPLKITAEEPVSTFSIDVDTASYGVMRSSINAGYLPHAQSLRIEEMINYFPYAWPTPDADGAPFRSTVSIMETPWNEGTQLVTVALQGQMPELEDRPHLNLVFLIDTSGSMSSQNKLPLLKQSFRLMLSQLRPEDQVAIVTYAGSAGMVLEPTSASERAKINAALGRLDAGGSTAGQAGLQQAYDLAAKMSEDGEVTRVLLATDGDFNVGLSNPDALKDYIAQKRESGTYLSVLGFGRGNLDDATMQALAQNGNGTAAYIDTLNEAQKVLVDQLSGALFPIADDVKIQVEWNPATVAEYRLIGYETRALAREDFNNDKVDAGEIGAGHSVTAIYEITPINSDARRTDPLRYGQTEVSDTATTDNELGFLRLRYKEPGEDVSKLIETPIYTDTTEGGPEASFAAAIAGFGQLLTDPKFLGEWGWDEAIALANASKGDDTFGYRTEAINLMRLAQSLSDQ